MNNDCKIKFYELYEKLASATATINEPPDITLIESLMSEIAAMFRLSKGVTHIYRNPGDEHRGRGETLCCYDTGKAGKPVHTVRFVTRLMSIVTMTAYMAEEEEPLTAEEFEMVDLAMRTVAAYISRNRLQEMAEELAFFDDDGYRNIRSFFNYMAWKAHNGDFDGKAALNYNLRHFSLVNEEYGRKAGDTVLRNHYRHMVGIIGESGILSRLGGDSFVCICEQKVLDEVIAYLTDATVPFDMEGNTISITACAGIFRIPDGYSVMNPNDIMGKIMQAYDKARNGGHDHIVFYDNELQIEKEKAMRVQKMFPDALKNKEFRVFYQPKVNIITGELCGAEALCRWFCNGEIVPPLEFIPVLERTSDICKLDFYVLDRVCADMRKWIDEGRKIVRVSVNLSRKHMMNSGLMEKIVEIVDRHNIPHEYIEIEMTETTTDVEFKALKHFVDELKQEKIFTSVDDFGMGYSSLNLIRVIPWNVLKVDKSFLPKDNEGEDSVRGIMFRHVVAMARELGLECIVEGVETPTQIAVLKSNQCELAQGFFFDRPIPLEEFEKRLDMKYYQV